MPQSVINLSAGELCLRSIQSGDNSALATLIRAVLAEFGANRPGFAWADPQLDSLFQFYQQPRSHYLVVEYRGRVLGGAGIAVLDGAEADVCELQKMYLAADMRGQGIGCRLISLLLDKAMAFGYRQCYLETMGGMHHAQALYRRKGFTRLEQPLGDTGHGGCDAYYLKQL